MPITVGVFGGHPFMRLGISHSLTNDSITVEAPDTDPLAWVKDKPDAVVLWIGMPHTDDKMFRDLVSREPPVIVLLELVTAAKAAALLDIGVSPADLNDNPADLTEQIVHATSNRVLLPTAIAHALGAAANGTKPIPRLNSEELGMLRMHAGGLTGEEIARAIARDPKTVTRRFKDICRHLGVDTRPEALVAARELGLL